jgi:Ca2+-binding RTX toxin-like protein
VADINDDTPTTGNPYLDSLIWGGKWVPDADDPGGVPHIAYYLASGQDPAFPSFVTSPWSPTQATAFASMLQLYANVANVQFDRVFDASQADVIERLTVSAHPYLDGAGGVHEVPDPIDENTGDPFYIEPLWGYYNTAVSTLANPTPGSFGFMLFVHEFGHALGLAHPHDGGSEDEQVFPGVTPNDSASLGDYQLNQGIWTVMSYNDGWNNRPPVSSAYGFEQTPMAFDIAALQVLYGANMSYHTGDDTYALPTRNGIGTGWSCIWDAGGIDTISAAGASAGCTIDLTAATLAKNDWNAAGVVSMVGTVIGGLTIANGVVIENATGGSGNDFLWGNASANVLNGGAGADYLDGRTGVDKLIGGTGNDSYILDDPLDSIEELAGGGTDRVTAACDYTLVANVEVLSLAFAAAAVNATGNSANNELDGNNNANRLDGGAGADSLYGSSGDDTYVVDNVGDRVTEYGFGGFDAVESTVSYTLGSELESLVLKGDGAINATGSASDNTLTGNAKNNILDGKAGADTMLGGGGDDTYIVDNEKDATDETGGAGSDLVKSSAATYTLSADIERLTLTGAALAAVGNEIANIIIGTVAGNNLSGMGGDDSLSGDNGDDTLAGGGDDDTLDGGAGIDLMTGGTGDDLYRIDVAGDIIGPGADEGIDKVESKIAFTLGAEQEWLTLLGPAAINGTGNDSSNIITGNVAANILDGGAAVDELIGGGGNDTYLVDASNDKVTEADKGGTDLVKSSQSFTLSGFVENLTLFGGGDIDGTGNALPNVIMGNIGANKLSGDAGNDTLTGGDGDDTLDGGGGNDAMTGGNDNDVYEVDSKTDKVTESSAAGGRDKVESAITYILGNNLEDLDLTKAGLANGTGNALDNLIVGSGDANLLDGKGGADTMKGGGGNDVYVIDTSTDRVDETGGSGSDTIQIATSFDLGSSSITLGAVENVTLTGTAAIAGAGNALANVLIGNSAANTLSGLGGNDTLDGRAGADTMVGDIGDDVYVVDNAKDRIQETASDAADRINASISIDLGLPVYDNIEDVLLLGPGAINATGDDKGNHLTGNTGANILDGKGENDTLAGDKGNDTYKVDSGADVVTEVANGGADTVLSTAATYTLTDANVENLTLLVGAVEGIGNDGKNKLIGNDADNALDGGGGVDTLVGGKGDDLYLVNDAKDVVMEAAGAGKDAVESTAASYVLAANVEHLTLVGIGNIAGTGNTLDNTLTGNSGDNALDGKTGKDHMTGNGGNDSYVVDNVGDVVDESGDVTGLDTVNSSISFSLVAGIAVLGTVENLTLTGAAAISGTGNDLANKIGGNAGANALFGGGESDTIEGGGGNDTVTGGAGDDRINVITGNDTVLYTSKLDGQDVIDNFDGNASGGQDVLNLDALFDTLSVSGNRADHVSIVVNTNGSVDVRVDADGNAGFELVVATLNLANPADSITVGQDVLVGS